MTSLPPEEEYPRNPFKDVNLLSKFNVSRFFVTGDRFSNWSFCYFEQFKVDVHFVDFGQV